MKETVEAPRAIVWKITSLCNMGCPECPCGRKAAGRPSPEIRASEADQVIDSIVRWTQTAGRPSIPDPTGDPGVKWSPGTLVLSGGEPLLRDDVFALARKASTSGLRVLMTSNGSLVDKEAALGIAASGVSAVAVSLDGAKAGSHDGVRGRKGAFAVAVTGVKRLVERGVPVRVLTRVTSRNVDEIHGISDLAHQLGASAHYVFPVASTPCRFRVEASQQLRADELDRLGRAVAARSARSSMSTVLIGARTGGCTTDSGMEAAAADWPSLGCGAGRRVAALSPEGDLFACPGLEFRIGNVRQQPIEQLWRKSKLLRGLMNHVDGCAVACPTCPRGPKRALRADQGRQAKAT